MLKLSAMHPTINNQLSILEFHLTVFSLFEILFAQSGRSSPDKKTENHLFCRTFVQNSNGI